MTTCHNDGLNPEPSDVQLYLFRFHKKNGTSPGNPRWYRDPGRKFRRSSRINVRVPRFGPARFPKLPTGTEYNVMLRAWRRDGADNPFAAAEGRPLLGYIKAFERARGLKSTLVDKAT